MARVELGPRLIMASASRRGKASGRWAGAEAAPASRSLLVLGLFGRWRRRLGGGDRSAHLVEARDELADVALDRVSALRDLLDLVLHRRDAARVEVVLEVAAQVDHALEPWIELGLAGVGVLREFA